MSIALSAQQNDVFKGKYLMGSLLPTSGIKDINGLGPIIGGEFSWEILPLGDEPYQFYCNFPSWGLSLMFMDYGKPSLLGQAINIYPFVSFPFVNNKYFGLNFMLGAGFNIQSKTNIYYSSSVILFVTFSLEGTFKFKTGNGLFFDSGAMCINN